MDKGSYWVDIRTIKYWKSKRMEENLRTTKQYLETIVDRTSLDIL